MKSEFLLVIEDRRYNNPGKGEYDFTVSADGIEEHGDNLKSLLYKLIDQIGDRHENHIRHRAYLYSQQGQESLSPINPSL
jgi:hypothetical protein